MYLIIDCITTGLFDFSTPADAEGQPRLANFGSILCDENLNEIIKTIEIFVKPDGWTISEEVHELTGLTTEICESEGIDIKYVMDMYSSEIDKGYVIVSYGARYDTKVMRGELRRLQYDDRYAMTQTIDLMAASTPICQIPFESGRKGYKFPKLQEACNHFGIVPPGKTAFQNARTALAIMRALKNQGALPDPKRPRNAL